MEWQDMGFPIENELLASAADKNCSKCGPVGYLLGQSEHITPTLLGSLITDPKFLLLQ